MKRHFEQVVGEWGETVTSIMVMLRKLAQRRTDIKAPQITAGEPSRDEMLEKIREYRVKKVANKNVPRSVVSKPWTF